MSRIAQVAASWPVIIMLFFLAMVPIWTPLAGEIEGYLLPVTSKVTWENITPDADGGVTLRMEFKKLRSCQFLGATMDRDGVAIEFHPIDNSTIFTIAPVTVLTPLWHAQTTDLSGVRLRFAYRCNPFWVTISTVYP